MLFDVIKKNEKQKKKDMETKQTTTMPRDYWMCLPVEVRKALVQKRLEAMKKYQGSITCEKYGVYMRA